MRNLKLLLIAAAGLSLVVAGTAVAQEAYGPWNEDQACSAGTCTRSPATPTGAIGMRMSTTKGYRVSVCAVSGQTLSGAGTLLAWRYNANRTPAVWERNKDLDRTISVSGPCATWGDTAVPAQIVNDRVLYAASGVTVSGGATVNVRVDISDL